MYRFVRRLTIREVSNMPAAMQFAAETTAYSNKTYSVNFKYGIEAYGEHNVYWAMDFDSLEKFREYTNKLSQDREYWALLQKANGLFVEGSVKDTLVSFAD